MQRRGALTLTFYVLAMLCYLRARRGKGWSAARIGWAFGVAACYWLAMKSKTLGLTLPFAILMAEFCLRATDRAARRRYLIVMLPGIAVSVVAMFAYASESVSA